MFDFKAFRSKIKCLRNLKNIKTKEIWCFILSLSIGNRSVISMFVVSEQKRNKTKTSQESRGKVLDTT